MEDKNKIETKIRLNEILNDIKQLICLVEEKKLFWIASRLLILKRTIKFELKELEK